MERGETSKASGNHALIRIQYLGQKQFCDIRLDNFTRESFLRDGKATQAMCE